MKPTDTVAEMKTCAKCGQLFRYPPSDNKEAETLCAYCAEPVVTLPACLCGLDTNPVASPRMGIHCPKHDAPDEVGGGPELRHVKEHLNMLYHGIKTSERPLLFKTTRDWLLKMDDTRVSQPADWLKDNEIKRLKDERNQLAQQGAELWERANTAQPSPTPADEEVARALAIRALTEQNSRFALFRSQDPDFREDDVRFWTLQFNAALAEARRAGTPTTDVREQAKAIVSRFNIDSCDWTDHPTTELINAIASAISSTPSDEVAQGTCTWTCEPNPDIEMWETDCGNAFQFEVGGPTENKMKFCAFCGKLPVEATREVSDG